MPKIPLENFDVFWQRTEKAESTSDRAFLFFSRNQIGIQIIFKNFIFLNFQTKEKKPPAFFALFRR